MKTFQTSREFNCTPEAIFAAIANPESLARWWGPSGFTNTFQVFEFRPGGKWSFIMHGPDGTNYPNESEFIEIVPNEKVVIRHACPPFFILTIQIEETENGSNVLWTQNFDSEEVAERISSIVIPSNEQNLDRLIDEIERTQ
jgi:uncharacterized protein YndB with AHSA1/START domain